ncbi:hypothetical protein [Bacillus sp. EB01]|uniref:hypothetical protein n=1 Tax=Bacillus sp. EB01 TaxID=1347086 RepID=UPI0005C716D2|nr:hypothetical protein [Bacillus sp. EB01]
MNHREALLQLTGEELSNIADMLKIGLFKESKPPWITAQIIGFYENANKFCSLADRFGETVLNELIMFVHTGKPLEDSHIQSFNQYGIFVKSQMPSDLKNRIETWTRSLFIKKFPDKKEEVIQSYFLQSFLLLDFLKKADSIKLKQRKNDKNVNAALKSLLLSKDKFWDILNHLVRTGIVSKSGDMYSINNAKHNSWRKQNVDFAIKQFYTDMAGKEVIRLLEVISAKQLDHDEWVELGIITGISVEYDKAKSLGLISSRVESGKEYVQLNPEAWVITKGGFHPLWNEQSILITASFEVFFPFYQDPFILNELLPFCTLKDSHYFLVFDINLDTLSNSYKALEYFFSTLKSKCRYVPDVVIYELESRLA